jgi:hypothetical protein
MSAWWDGMARTVATVDCDGATHRLEWERGELLALDHAHPERERVAAALGGRAGPCIELLELWNRHRANVDVLLIASRGPGDLPAAEDYPNHTINGSDAELRRLLRLGGALPERLVANVVASIQPDTPLPLLDAALYGRLVLAVRQWLASDRPVEVERLAPGGPRSLSFDGETVTVALPFEWLGEVWVRGFTTILGRFCLAAASVDGVRWTLTVVGTRFGPPETVVLELPPALAGS